MSFLCIQIERAVVQSSSPHLKPTPDGSLNCSLIGAASKNYWMIVKTIFAIKNRLCLAMRNVLTLFIRKEYNQGLNIGPRKTNSRAAMV